MKTHLLSRETISVKVGGEPAANSICCNLVNMLSIWLGPGCNIYVENWSIWYKYGLDQVATYKLQPGQYGVNMAWTRLQHICCNLVKAILILIALYMVAVL